MTKQKDYKIQDCASPHKSVRTLKKDQDINNIGHLGKAMRFFLNGSVGLTLAFIVFITVGPQRLTFMSVSIATIPFLITIIFFLAFLRQLMRIEECATKRRNIEMVSRIITEYNKSYLIRLVTGKVQTFIEEE